MKTNLPLLLAACTFLPGFVLGAERLDRAVVVVPNGAGQTYIGWRLLASDPPDVTFDVYRCDRTGGARQKLNASPIANCCNLVDAASTAAGSTYVVRANGKKVPIVETPPQAPSSDPGADPASSPYVRLKLQGDYRCDKVAIADLDGDGKYDFVVKQPNQVTDPGVWHPSVDSFKVEAYRSDGTFLWRKDLGWNIEQGIWYSPMVVYDFNGDGKAEVAIKTAPTDKDYRNETGRVLDGPEYCSILDGMTGREIARTDWVPRGKISDWGDDKGNRASRHMLGVAYLDGKTPTLLVHRGTYTTMRVDAYNLRGKGLRPLWSWNGDLEQPPVRGQGLHGLHAADLNDDGRDEVLLGAAALTSQGRLLWNTGLGHPDACYVGDIDPARPGKEIIYGIEPPHGSNGICLVEARTGKLIWGCSHPTKHVHSQGLFADIDPDNPGPEFYAGEKFLSDHWMYSARTGKLLSTEDLGSLAPTPVYWTDGPYKVYVRREKLLTYKGPQLGSIQGRVVAIADVLGDWREEIITTLPGEVRIYTTKIPSTTRRVCLMQDRMYRTDVAMETSGYLYPPQPGGQALKN